VKDHPIWKDWISLKSGANDAFYFHGRIFQKDVPNDSEKLMTKIIDCMNAHQRAQVKKKAACSELDKQEIAKFMASMNTGVTIGDTLSSHFSAENEEAKGDRAMRKRSKEIDLVVDYRADDERAKVDDVKEDFVMEARVEEKESAEVMRQQFEAAAKQLNESKESAEVMHQQLEAVTKEQDESKEFAEAMRQQLENATKQQNETKELTELVRQLLEVANKQLDESKESAELMRQQLEAMTNEMKDMKYKFSGSGAANSDIETVGDVAANAQSPVINKMDKLPLIQEREGKDEENEICMKEAFASELQAKDAIIRTLDNACKEMEATINALRLEMVKMSSTYKQDNYLKRKEIAKLTKQKAAYALKLSTFDKAFTAVNVIGNITTVSTNDHSMHSGGEGGGGGVRATSFHGRMVHLGSHGGKEGKAAAVSAQLGGFRLWVDSKVVKEANFFDNDATSDRASSQGGGSGGKGEDPEEC
jgi:hypothetical protein